MKNIVLLSILSALIQGCTSLSQPTASRPLVESEFVIATKSVDSSLGEALSNTKIGTPLFIGRQPAVMGDNFFAATGLICRKLTIEKTGQHIYCLNAQSKWFKIKKVISEYNENVMSGASL